MVSVIWENILHKIDFAFQPIVNPITGVTYAVESLLRGYERAGFKSIEELFDTAYSDSVLSTVDYTLKKKAIAKFKKFPFYNEIKLFYNYDPRVFECNNYSFNPIERIIKDENIQADNICLELSEKHKFDFSKLNQLLIKTREHSLQIALDDFGSGFSGLELFFNTEPEIIKFDKFLISGIDYTVKKHIFTSQLLDLAKKQGAIVIAEGVETEEEYLTCKEIGFDLVQGYFIQRPTCIIEEINLFDTNDFISSNKLDKYISSDEEREDLLLFTF